jgi:hypothetical protein
MLYLPQYPLVVRPDCVGLHRLRVGG